MLRDILGVSESELNVDALNRLIANRTQESQHLDYKSESPHPNKEFARDVAAMANGGGGIIVIGILDENNQPVKENPIPLTNETSRLQQVINSNVQPFCNIHWHEVKEQANTSSGFIVVEILPSERIPFAVEEGDGILGFYARSGQHRATLAEAQVQQMYRERFRRQSAIVHRLDELESRVKDAIQRSPNSKGISCVYLVASPVAPSTRLFRPTRQTTRTLEERRNHFRSQFALDAEYGLLRFLRPGFKRIEFASNPDFDPKWLSKHGWIEFHDDGSYVTAIPGEFTEIPASGSGSRFVDTLLTFQFVDRLVAYDTLATHFGFTGEVLLRTGIQRQGRAILEWDPRRAELYGSYQLPESVATHLNVDVRDLTPSPHLIEISKTLLDDLFTAFGWPECLQLSEDGAFRSHYLGAEKDRLSRWAKQFGVEWTDERVTF